jgi:hypothetical protein
VRFCQQTPSPIATSSSSSAAAAAAAAVLLLRSLSISPPTIRTVAAPPLLPCLDLHPTPREQRVATRCRC